MILTALRTIFHARAELDVGQYNISNVLITDEHFIVCDGESMYRLAHNQDPKADDGFATPFLIDSVYLKHAFDIMDKKKYELYLMPNFEPSPDHGKLIVAFDDPFTNTPRDVTNISLLPPRFPRYEMLLSTVETCKTTFAMSLKQLNNLAAAANKREAEYVEFHFSEDPTDPIGVVMDAGLQGGIIPLQPIGPADDEEVEDDSL